VRPGGPGWRRQRERTGIASDQDLGLDVLRVLAGLLLLLGLMFGVGGLVMLRPTTAAVMFTIATAGLLWLRALRRRIPDRARAPVTAGGGQDDGLTVEEDV
jgi:hypothetical protein